jgi:hypothetical protein
MKKIIIMKKTLFTILFAGTAIAAQAQKTDSTECQKMQARIDAYQAVYSDSFNNMRLAMVKKNQEDRRKYMSDSLAGKIEKGATAPTPMTPEARQLIVALKKREFMLIRPIQTEMKKLKCQESGKMPEKMPVKSK